MPQSVAPNFNNPHALIIEGSDYSHICVLRFCLDLTFGLKILVYQARTTISTSQRRSVFKQASVRAIKVLRTQEGEELLFVWHLLRLAELIKLANL